MFITKENKKLLNKFDSTLDLSHSLKTQIQSSQKLYLDISEKFSMLKDYESKIESLVNEKTKSFPWLSKAIADYIALQDERVANHLEIKSHPAKNTAEKIRIISKEKRVLVEQLQLAKYTVDYYETLFPFLTEFREDNIDDALLQILESRYQHSQQLEDENPLVIWAPERKDINETYAERNQRALNNYMKSEKNSFQIGKAYERYIGYIYESNGFQVTYFGIKEGKADMGRDLICKKGNLTEIVQCKCWRKAISINENHINQLFGTTIKYYLDSNETEINKKQLSFFPELLKEGKISATLYTSTNLSETAKKFSLALGINIFENFGLKPYPIIKCHVSKESGERIYHLPFDQMYDKTIIESNLGEFYASTVKEAEDKGFKRRAWHWSGNSED